MRSANGSATSRPATSGARTPTSAGFWLAVGSAAVTACATSAPSTPPLVSDKLSEASAARCPLPRQAPPPIFPLLPPPPPRPLENRAEGLESAIRAANRAAEAIRRSHARRVAILDINNLDGSQTMLGRFLADEIMTVLHKNRAVAVVDRHLVRAVALDPRLLQRGAFDEHTAAEIGAKVEADAVLMGTITAFGDQLRLNLRVVRSRTGEVQVVEQAILVADAAVRKLWEETN